jgi:EAL domain-containing protein (putative c-di-GMP-specific phosphodiesterase class I)
MKQALAELRLKWSKLAVRDKLLSTLGLLALVAPLGSGVKLPVLALVGILFARRRLASNLMGLRVTRAIRRRELFLCFQPKIDLSKGRVEGVEALVRWSDPKRGLVSPADFIEGVEASIFGRALDSFVLSAAVEHAKTLEQSGRPTSVAVNLSPASFEDPELAGKLCALLDEADLSPDLLQIEVTERVLDAAPNAASVIATLGEHGIGVALDDFGVGYSALQRLVRLELQCLKIDRSFVAEMETNPRAAVIIAWAVTLAHELGATVVAEGVEDEDTVHRLRALGVDCIQGYFISKPLTAQELAVWLERTDTSFADRRRGLDRRLRPEVRKRRTERRSWEDRRSRELAERAGRAERRGQWMAGAPPRGTALSSTR